MMDARDKQQAREATHLYVHGGMMHADDVLVAAMLKELHPDLTVDRVRALPDPMPDHALAADIGGGVFDHHQPDAALREDGHKHAACGLVLEAVQSDLFPNGVPKQFAEDVRSIEDQDNGVVPEKENPLTNLVRGMNPQWDETRTLDQAFSDAVDFVQAEYLKPYRERGELSLTEQKTLTDKQADLDARRADATEKAKAVVQDAFFESNGTTVVFNKAGVPWKDELCPTSAAYVVYPSARGGWNLQCVPPEPKSFAQKEPLPEAWLTAEGKEQSGATFVHQGRFLASFPTKEAALRGAELSHAHAVPMKEQAMEKDASLFPEQYDDSWHDDYRYKRDAIDALGKLPSILDAIHQNPNITNLNPDSWKGHEDDYIEIAGQAQNAYASLRDSNYNNGDINSLCDNFQERHSKEIDLHADVETLRDAMKGLAAHRYELDQYLDGKIQAYIKQAEPDQTHGKSAAELARMLADGNKTEREMYAVTKATGTVIDFSNPDKYDTVEWRPGISDFYQAKDKLTASFVKTAMKEQEQSGKIAGVDRILVEGGYWYNNMLASIHDKDGNNINIRTHIDGMEEFGISEDDITRLSDKDSQARMQEAIQTFAGHMADAERSGMTLPKCVDLMREGAKVNDLVSYLTPGLTIPRERDMDQNWDFVREKQEDLWKTPDLAAHKERCEHLTAAFVPLAEQAIDGKNLCGNLIYMVPPDKVPDKDEQKNMDLRPIVMMPDTLVHYGWKAPEDYRLFDHLGAHTQLAERTDGIDGIRDISWNNGDTYDIALCDPETPGRTESILSVSADALQDQGITPLRLEGLAERYSGPFVDVYLTKDAEDRVKGGISEDLREGTIDLWNRAGNGYYDMPDMDFAGGCCWLADCHSLDECKDLEKKLIEQEKDKDLSEERDDHDYMKEGEEY